MKTIPFSDIEGVRVGNAQDSAAMTGVTVFLFPEPAPAAVTVLGGGPASRETALLDPERNVQPLDALVLAGGSTFGLEASHGVLDCLERRGIGFYTGDTHVPIVCQSDIYDLSYGACDVRPDKAMGFAACEDALAGGKAESGNVGAGTGATVGKPKGLPQAQKSGIGYAAAQLGALQVGVAAVVNAYGDIFHEGMKVAGMMTVDRGGFADSTEVLLEMQPSNLFTGNTTLVAVFTNAKLTPSALKKVSGMASAGMARAIRPVFTMADGDTVYALSVGSEKVDADVNVVGTMAAGLVEEAIFDAVESSRIPEEEYLDTIQHGKQA
ncbi:MAG: P1 family peptidase [Bacteroidales bacterium]|nr:P1 family peptidase [Bacteroidales bacterium]